MLQKVTRFSFATHQLLSFNCHALQLLSFNCYPSIATPFSCHALQGVDNKTEKYPNFRVLTL